MATLITSASKRSSDNMAVTTDAADTTGANLIVLEVASYEGNVASAPTDSKSNTWTPLTKYGSDNRIKCYYCISPTVGSGHTFTVPDSGLLTYPSIAMLAFSGADSYDQENGNNASTQAGSVTPANSGAIIIAAIGHTSGTTPPTIDSGFTVEEYQDYSGSMGIAAAYLIQGSASAVNPAWNISGNPVNITVFNPTGGGGGTAVPALTLLGVG